MLVARGYLASLRSSANKIFDYMPTGKPIINAYDTNHSPLVYSGLSTV